MASQSGSDLHVAVDELHVLDVGPALAQVLEARVAGAGRRERDRQVQLDDRDPERPRRLDRAVGGARVDVDDPIGLAAQGAEATAQPFALVAADRDRPYPLYAHPRELISRRTLHRGLANPGRGGKAASRRGGSKHARARQSTK